MVLFDLRVSFVVRLGMDGMEVLGRIVTVKVMMKFVSRAEVGT